MEKQGKGARRLEASFFRTDGAVRTLARRHRAAGDAAPTSSTACFASGWNALSDPLDPGFGFDLIRLSASRTEIVVQQQRDLDAHVHDNDELAALIDRIAARIGGKRVVVHLPQDTHIPERAVLAAPAQHHLAAATAGRLAGARGRRAAVAAAAAVRQAGADQGAAGHRAGRPAASFHLAACGACGGAGGRTRAHRHGMVEAGRQGADARLFPRRG